MAIYAISDFHGQLPDHVPGDATSLIIVGDVCPDFISYAAVHARTAGMRAYDGHQQQRQWLEREFRAWCESHGLPTYVTFGNHDFIGEYPFLWPTIPMVEFIIDDWQIVGGYKTWFYPYTPNLSGWALKAEPPKSDEILARIPDDIEIFATHGPPLGAGDAVPTTSRFNGGPHPLHVGDEAVMRAIPTIGPFVTICGHIHEARGVHTLPGSDQVVVNVAAVNDDYVMYDDPFVDLTPFLPEL